ncbi:MAG: hypothetical protein AAGJ91_01485 [Pseudomonadota bacterium]
MKTSIFSALAIAALSAPAFAADFTPAQLIELRAAEADDNALRVAQITAQAEAGGYNGTADFSQIASSVDAEGYAPNAVVAVKAASDDDDSLRLFGLRNVNGEGATVSTRGSGMTDQLARSVGVAPGTLSTAELVLLKSAQADDDHIEINRILSKIN